MNWHQLAYFVFIVIAAMVMGLLAWYARRRREVPGSEQYMWTVLLVSLMSVFDGLSMTAQSKEWALFWFNVRFLCSAAYPVAWLIFAIYYTGKTHLLSVARIAILLIIPVLTQVFIWTNDLHGLWAASEVAFLKTGVFYSANLGTRISGLWYYVHILYSYLLIVLGLIVVYTSFVRIRKELWGQALLFGFGALVMIFGALLPSFNITTGEGVNTLIPGMVLGSLLIAWVVYRHRLLEEVPPLAMENKNSVLLMVLFFAAVSGILITGSFYYRHYERGFRDRLAQEMTAIAELKRDDILHWRTERLGDADSLYKNDVFTALAHAYLGGPADAGAGWKLKTWMGKIQAAYGYDHVLLLDAHGETRISAPSGNTPVCAFIRRHLPEIAATGSVSFIDFHRVAPDSPVMLAVVVPVMYNRPAAGIMGYVVLDIDPGGYLYPLLARWPTPAETAESLLVRKDGDEVVFLSELKFMKNTALHLRFPLSMESLPAAMAARGHEGVVEGIDYRGARVLAALKKIPGSPWYLVTRMDIDEVYAPVRERFWVLVVLVLTLIGSTGAGVMYLWRRQSDSFNRERLEAAAALQRNEALIRSVLDNLPVGIAVNSIDPSIQFGYMNDNFPLFYRTTRDKIKDPDTFWSAVYEDPVYREIVRKRVLDDCRSGDHERMCWQDIPITRPGEETTYITAKNIPLPEKGLMISAVWDVTDRKRAEDRLLHFAEELQRSNVDLQQFAYVASHDLQEPLRMISSYLQLIERRYKDRLDDDANDFINYAVDGAKRLQSLISGLLEFSRVTTHGKEFSKVNTDKVLEEVCRDLDLVIRETGAKILHEALPEVVGDQSQIYRLFQNLIQNGVKFRRKDVAPVIEITAVREAAEHVFRVRDNGIGIEERYFDRIFTIFQRLHGRDEYPGTGIGLSICKRIVERHGGKIRVESKPGEGSSFYFSIPVGGPDVVK